tara:strand:+ start:341 stop:865 length:525 start_codon:yes stop_codon:yes gene_type:complete
MSLWGKKDTVYSVGKVNCTAEGVVTKQSGAGLDFASNCEVGQVVTLADKGSGQGQGVIKSIDSATQMTLTNIDLPGAFSATDYEVRETPIAEVNGGSFAIGEIFGVDTNEIGIANTATAGSEARKFAPPHAGWVGITTYNDHLGNLRIKSEVLVAGSSITGDSSDDTTFPDTAS